VKNKLEQKIKKAHFMSNHKKRTRDSGIQEVSIKHKKILLTTLKEWTTPDFRNTPSTTNLEEEEIVDAPGKDGSASIPEQVKRSNPWRKMMMMMMILCQIPF
jgi:hypothetical protein